MKKTRFTKVLALTLVLLMVMSSTVFGAITPGNKLSNELNAIFNVSKVPTSQIISERIVEGTTKVSDVGFGKTNGEATLTLNYSLDVNGNITGQAKNDLDAQVPGTDANKLRGYHELIAVRPNEDITHFAIKGIMHDKVTNTDLTWNQDKQEIVYSQGVRWYLYVAEKIIDGETINWKPFGDKYGYDFTIEWYNGDILIANETLKVDVVNNSTVQTSMDVYNEADLREALALDNIITINIKNDITAISSRVVVDRDITINGEDHKLTFTGDINGATYGLRHGILVSANGVTINNLAVEMTENLADGDFTGWDGVYGIQVINATDVVLNNVSATKADGGILVNGAEVELTGTTTVSGNEFGGIEVSQGEGVPNEPSLTVTGTLVNMSEKIAVPTIWEDGVFGNVTSSGTDLTQIGINGQQQYYLLSSNAIPVTLEGLSGIINATVNQLYETTVTATNKDKVLTVENAKLVIEVSKPNITTSDLSINGITASKDGDKLIFTKDLTNANELNITFNTDGEYAFVVYVTQQ